MSVSVSVGVGGEESTTTTTSGLSTPLTTTTTTTTGEETTTKQEVPLSMSRSGTTTTTLSITTTSEEEGRGRGRLHHLKSGLDSIHTSTTLTTTTAQVDTTTTTTAQDDTTTTTTTTTTTGKELPVVVVEVLPPLGSDLDSSSLGVEDSTPFPPSIPSSSSLPPLQVQGRKKREEEVLNTTTTTTTTDTLTKNPIPSSSGSDTTSTTLTTIFNTENTSSSSSSSSNTSSSSLNCKEEKEDEEGCNSKEEEGRSSDSGGGGGGGGMEIPQLSTLHTHFPSSIHTSTTDTHTLPPSPPPKEKEKEDGKEEDISTLLTSSFGRSRSLKTPRTPLPNEEAGEEGGEVRFPITSTTSSKSSNDTLPSLPLLPPGRAMEVVGRMVDEVHHPILLLPLPPPSPRKKSPFPQQDIPPPTGGLVVKEGIEWHEGERQVLQVQWISVSSLTFSGYTGPLDCEGGSGWGSCWREGRREGREGLYVVNNLEEENLGKMLVEEEGVPSFPLNLPSSGSLDNPKGREMEFPKDLPPSLLPPTNPKGQEGELIIIPKRNESLSFNIEELLSDVTQILSVPLLHEEPLNTTPTTTSSSISPFEGSSVDLYLKKRKGKVGGGGGTNPPLFAMDTSTPSTCTTSPSSLLPLSSPLGGGGRPFLFRKRSASLDFTALHPSNSGSSGGSGGRGGGLVRSGTSYLSLHNPFTHHHTPKPTIPPLPVNVMSAYQQIQAQRERESSFDPCRHAYRNYLISLHVPQPVPTHSMKVAGGGGGGGMSMESVVAGIQRMKSFMKRGGTTSGPSTGGMQRSPSTVSISSSSGGSTFTNNGTPKWSQEFALAPSSSSTSTGGGSVTPKKGGPPPLFLKTSLPHPMHLPSPTVQLQDIPLSPAVSTTSSSSSWNFQGEGMAFCTPSKEVKEGTTPPNDLIGEEEDFIFDVGRMKDLPCVPISDDRCSFEEDDEEEEEDDLTSTFSVSNTHDQSFLHSDEKEESEGRSGSLDQRQRRENERRRLESLHKVRGVTLGSLIMDQLRFISGSYHLRKRGKMVGGGGGGGGETLGGESVPLSRRRDILLPPSGL